ncbi:hypothetical protein L1987_71070 [Smallanthus sonchifolius]|uniref:Uncharacterized protein n=1 Tax=Smallanthus sonchifolius TaxID=185202 RepID=A0ACB9ARM7_9ASTR|nr:hypothetical protein L1987_71070 [Smallanthus sonchifolius]
MRAYWQWKKAKKRDEHSSNKVCAGSIQESDNTEVKELLLYSSFPTSLELPRLVWTMELLGMLRFVPIHLSNTYVK